MERPYNCQKCEKPYKVHWDLDHKIPFERDPTTDLKTAGIDLERNIASSITQMIRIFL